MLSLLKRRHLGPKELDLMTTFEDNVTSLIIRVFLFISLGVVKLMMIIIFFQKLFSFNNNK